MKKIILLFLIASIGISCSKVPAGFVGVKVYLLGRQKGVNQEVLSTGQYWIGFNEELYLYETFNKTYPFTQSTTEGSPIDEAFYFQTKEGVKCNVDISIQSKVDSLKVSELFQTYRQGLEGIIKSFMKNNIRDLIIKYSSEMTIEDLYSSKKVELLKNVEKDLKSIYSEKGIIIENISFLSDIRFPTEIEQSITAKIKATQQAIQRENELRETEAKAKIMIAQTEGESQSLIIKAKAEAESNKLKMLAITQQLLEYERIMNERKAIEKWNGVTPTYTNGNIIPFTNVR